MQDTVTLGGLTLPTILTYHTEQDNQNKVSPLGIARRGGIHIGKSAYGPSTLVLDGVLYITDAITTAPGDTLDNLFSTFRSAVIDQCAIDEKQLYLQDDWFYQVRHLDTIEVSRGYAHIYFTLKLSCERGRRFSDTEVSSAVSSGGSITITSEANTPVFIHIATTSGSTYTITDGTNTVSIVATVTGTAILDTERNLLWRGTASAQSELRGISPEFIPGVAKTLTLTGVGSVTVKYRGAKI